MNATNWQWAAILALTIYVFYLENRIDALERRVIKGDDECFSRWLNPFKSKK